MASTKKRTCRNQQYITVDFVGNKPISWAGEEEPSSSSAATLPASIDQSESGPSTQSSSAELPEPTTDSELRERFVDYVKKTIEAFQVEGDEGTFAPTEEIGSYAVQKTALYMLLAALHDPSSEPNLLDMSSWKKQKSRRLDKFSHETFFKWCCSIYLPNLKKIHQLWSNNLSQPAETKLPDRRRNRTTDEGVETRSMKKEKIVQEDQGTSESEWHKADPITQPVTQPAPTQPAAAQPAASFVKEGRTDEERKAQNNVPKWYAGRCVLSNALGAQGAHIVPVRALVKAKRNHDHFCGLLDMFWSQKDWNTRCPPEMIEEANILPLEAGVHYKWDRYSFAVRPINHVSDDDPCHLWVQMVWLNDTHESGGLVLGDWDHFSGTIINCRQAFSKEDEDTGHTTLNFPIVRHGDVFLLQTTDPKKYPLPDKGYLEIQFAVHKMLSGIVAQGALEDIFRGPLPPGGPDIPANAPIPWMWEVMLNRAGEIGILNTEEEEQWRQVIQAYFFALDEELKAQTMASLLDLHGGRVDTGESSKQQQTDKRD